MTEQAVLWLFLSGVASLLSYLAGSLNSGPAWAHRTRVREMIHAEKMALIEERRRMLEMKP